MNKTISVSIHDPNNIGDQVCNPCDYFPELKDVQRVDAWDWGQWIYDTESNIIFGGGGLIHCILAQMIARVQRNPRRKLIAWGLGHNQHGETTNDYAGCLDGFDLIGVRDFKRAQAQDWDYVPCASCMHPALDESKRLTKTRCFVVYQHIQHPIALREPPFAYLTLSNDVKDASVPITLMGTSTSVVTNSYHGAYWAMLMNRSVSIYKPFSSRFWDFKYQPPFCDENDWNKGQNFFSPPDYLGECCALNRLFYGKVKQTLGINTGESEAALIP